MQLKIGKNEIEFLKEYPRSKGPSAKEIAKKLEAIGYTCWEYDRAEDHYQCSIAPYCGPITSHILIDVYDDHFCYATKFNFRVVKNIDQEIPHGVFDGWNVQATKYVNNFDFKEEFFVEYRDWFIRKMKENLKKSEILLRVKRMEHLCRSIRHVRFKKELDISLLSLNAEVENEN